MLPVANIQRKGGGAGRAEGVCLHLHSETEPLKLSSTLASVDFIRMSLDA